MQDESFGPVIGIMKVKDDEEAIQLDAGYGIWFDCCCYSGDQAKSRTYFTANKRRNRLLELLRSRERCLCPGVEENTSGFGVTLSHTGLGLL